MKVKTITVSAGRTLSMPKTDYQNVRPQVTFEADLEKGEDHLEAAKKLHQQAEEFMENICDELRAFAAYRQQKRVREALGPKHQQHSSVGGASTNGPEALGTAHGER